MKNALQTIAYHLIEFGDHLDSYWLTPIFIRMGTALYRIADGKA